MTAHSNHIEEAGNQEVSASALPTGLSSLRDEAASASSPEASIPSRDEDPDEAVAAAQMERDVWRDIEVRRTTPSNDGWIEWSGGECPVEAVERVEIKLRDGEKNSASAHAFWWGRSKHESTGDIISYRVVSE